MKKKGHSIFKSPLIPLFQRGISILTLREFPAGLLPSTQSKMPQVIILCVWLTLLVTSNECSVMAVMGLKFQYIFDRVYIFVRQSGRATVN